MSEVPVKETPVADPAAIAPTTMATEASSDPIRPTGTDALVPDSRPEVTDVTPATGAAAGTAAPAEEKVGEDAVKIEAQPIAEGVLGYKAPGLIKSLRFSKKFFWFGDEALDEKALSTYVREEKPAIAHHNAAHASQTGKGLLFFAKRIEDKSQPAGVLNLGDASDVTKEELNDFSFKLNGHKHTFQASSRAERDSWLVAVETKVTEAKAAREGIVNSEGYKNHMSKLAGPVVTGLTPVAAAKSTSTPPKTEEPVSKTSNDKEVPAAAAATTAATETTPKVSDKSRSQSRKRGSIFGKVLGKKEEHDDKKEVKKEEKAEAKEIKKEEKAEEKAEKAEIKEAKKEAKHDHTGTAEPAPLDATAVAARVVGEPVVPAEGATTAATTETTAVPTEAERPGPSATKTKRGSVFGNLFNKKDNASPTRERKEKDVAPAVPAKDAEPTTAATEAAATETTPASAEAPAAGTSSLETASPTTHSKATMPYESKGGLFGFIKQKDTQHEAKKDVKAEEKTETPATAPVTGATGTPTAPGTDTAPVAPSTSTTVTATTPEPVTKDKRRQSFFGTGFGTLSSKKEKKSETHSEGEGTEGEARKSSGGLGGLFRKASRSVKGSSGPVTDSSAPPAPISKDAPAPTTAAAGEESAVPKTNGNVESAVENHIEPAPKTEQPATVSASA